MGLVGVDWVDFPCELMILPSPCFARPPFNCWPWARCRLQRTSLRRRRRSRTGHEGGSGEKVHFFSWVFGWVLVLEFIPGKKCNVDQVDVLFILQEKVKSQPVDLYHVHPPRRLTLCHPWDPLTPDASEVGNVRFGFGQWCR